MAVAIAEIKPRIFVDNETFLQRVRDLFPIQTIFYPGPEYDNSLETIFSPDEITYLDRNKAPKNGHVIFADYNDIPIPDESFDALFLQDNHPTRDQLDKIITKLKPGGVIIHSNYDCGEAVSLYQMMQIPGIQRQRFPVENMYYTVFQKIPSGIEPAA